MKAIGKSSLASGLKVALDIFWFLTIAGLCISVGLAVLGVTTHGKTPGRMNIPVLAEIDPGCYSISAPDFGISGAELQDVEAELRFRPSGKLLVLFAGYLAAAFGIVLVVLFQLRRIMATLAAGSPFVAANAWRIRFIGWAVIIGEVVSSSVEMLGQVIIKNSFQATGITFQWTYNMSVQTLFWGFVLIALAEVFRLGVEMREEQSLTV
jgi:hypothetical protein